MSESESKRTPLKIKFIPFKKEFDHKLLTRINYQMNFDGINDKEIVQTMDGL